MVTVSFFFQYLKKALIYLGFASFSGKAKMYICIISLLCVPEESKFIFFIGMFDESDTSLCFPFCHRFLDSFNCIREVLYEYGKDRYVEFSKCGVL